MIFPLSLLFLVIPSLVQAGSSQSGSPCRQNDTRLEVGTYELTGDCDSVTFCNSTGLCQPKGCRRDEFPFGYPEDDPHLPPKCPQGQFCPDEEDACQDLLPLGSACQLNRDDECEPPPNATEFANFPSNYNGSVCLNFQCMWANMTAGDGCVIENTPYIAYTETSEFVFVVSRGNCVPGLYCDALQKICMPQLDIGANCTADKECASDNCLSTNLCGPPADAPAHFPTWVYIVVGTGIFGGMGFTLAALFLVHRRIRDVEREKRTQYWREQTAFRQNILQMRETARSGYHRDPNDPPSQIASGDSQIPMLPSKNRNMSDDDRSDGEYGLINTSTHRRKISRPRLKR